MVSRVIPSSLYSIRRLLHIGSRFIIRGCRGARDPHWDGCEAGSS
jgi:hypothetical protein